MTEKEYLCTRPRLASILIQAGMTPRQTVNPWDISRTAWAFPLTPELRTAVQEYYQRIGKPVPAAVRTEGGVMP